MVLPLSDTPPPSSNLKLCELTFIPISLLTEGYSHCSPWGVRMKPHGFSHDALPGPSMEDDSTLIPSLLFCMKAVPDFLMSYLEEGPL